MALILNLETATEVCSVALIRDGKTVAKKECAEGMNHAKRLTSFVEEILKEKELNISDLDAVAVSGGPGSYTGLRIGVSAAKGLCYGAGIPLISVSTLQAMAHHVANNIDQYNIKDSDSILFCPMIDARRMEVYNAFYNKENKEIQPIQATIVDEDTFIKLLDHHKIVFFGNGSAKCKETIQHENAIFVDNIKASASYFGAISEAKLSREETEDVAYYEPFYLKDFVATVSKKNILGI